MLHEIHLTLSPEEAALPQNYIHLVEKQLGFPLHNPQMMKVVQRSVDARSRNIKINLKIVVAVNEPMEQLNEPEFEYGDVRSKPEIFIIGAGPAGLFAALRSIELGYKPIIFERGKDVKERRKDIAALNRNTGINGNSNYCFGEGGAGTYSDGKLYTRSKKRGDFKKILKVLHFHGASDEILIDAHPHIGTNRLPSIIENIRNSILHSGGEIHYHSRLIDIEHDSTKILAFSIENVENSSQTRYTSDNLILATGHSARDIYQLLQRKEILIEAKPFAMGVRVEHPQQLIDSIQYHCEVRNPHLPAASYNLTAQSESRGVYSFCMCPGGFIVPAATAEGEIVVNGMSPASRNSKFANSGIVVEIQLEDIKEYAEYGALAGLKYQQSLEQLAFINGGQSLTAPAQRLTDFVKGKISVGLPDTSYQPGIVTSPLHFWLPELISKKLQDGFKQFGKRMYGYLTNEAAVIGVESRTSSPVRIPRNHETLCHVQIAGLYPAGEGAGYAGGIVSAAVDGERCAEKVAEYKK